MSVRIAILLVWATAPLAFAQTPQACPWLTAGTVANVLGGSVNIVAHSDSNWSGRCVFTATDDPTRKVDVLVGEKDPHACGSDATPISAIGNQAQFCSYRDARGREVQAITGRVRDAWFAVTVSMPLANGSGPRDDSSDIQFLAEQVAGNLY